MGSEMCIRDSASSARSTRNLYSGTVLERILTRLFFFLEFSPESCDAVDDGADERVAGNSGLELRPAYTAAVADDLLGRVPSSCITRKCRDACGFCQDHSNCSAASFDGKPYTTTSIVHGRAMRV